MSKEQQAQEQPQVAIPLPKAKKNLVQIGCICMMLSVAMYGLVFATLTAPILEKVDAMGYVGLFSIVGAIGVSIMTPIGGKLGDLIGRRNIVVIPDSTYDPQTDCQPCTGRIYSSTIHYRRSYQ